MRFKCVNDLCAPTPFLKDLPVFTAFEDSVRRRADLLSRRKRGEASDGTRPYSNLQKTISAGKGAHAKVKLHTKDGRVIERELQAGRDTAEWAYDRADVRAEIQHERPRVAESWNEAGFAGQAISLRPRFAASADRRPLERRRAIKAFG